MGAKLKMQEDWPSPTWASQRAWLPNIWGGGVFNYTNILGPWRMDYSYPVKDAEPWMVRNFKSPWTGGTALTQFVFQNQLNPQPSQPRDVYISGVIYDPTSIQYDSEGNMLPPYGYVAWNRLAADLNHLKEFVGRLTVKTKWYDESNGTSRFVDTVVTNKSINNDTDTTPFQPTGDFVTTANPWETGQFWDFTIASS